MRPMKVERGYKGEDRLTTHWERLSHGWTHYLWIDPYYVERGSHRGTPQIAKEARIRGRNFERTSRRRSQPVGRA